VSSGVLTRKVLGGAYISLTCFVDAKGAVQWWLTKESGQFPCLGDKAEEDLTYAEGLEVRCAYLVLKVRQVQGGHYVDFVVFAEMKARAFEVLVDTVLPYLGQVDGCGRRDGAGPGTMSLMGCLDDGMFSHDEGCGCDLLHGVCSLCAAMAERYCRFLWQDRFDGVFPLGSGHWWTGVTDAVGLVEGELWLS
jgi:hypothetical protein